MNDASSIELVVVSNSSFPRSVSARGEEVEVDGDRAARNSTVAASSSVAVAMTGEKKGNDDRDEATRDGIAARNKEFFRHRRKDVDRSDAEAAQKKHAAHSQLSPKARQAAEEAEIAAEEHEKVKNHMLQTQLGAYKAGGGGRGRGRGRGGRGNFAAASNRSAVSPVAVGDAAEERRRSPDGKDYTKAEFIAFYGGSVEWNAAETAVNPRGRHYSVDV